MNLKYNQNTSGIGQAERQVLDAISRFPRSVIRVGDLEGKLGYNRARLNLMLSRLCKKGWIQRLQSGVYRIVPLGSESIHPVPEDAWAIAMELFSPCYISGWTAAEHWEFTEQIFNSVVIFTEKKQRKTEVSISGLKYVTKFISSRNIFGIKKIWSSNTPILIADIHKTIIDILDDPQIGGGGRQVIDIVKEYFKNKDANPEILCQYAEKLNHGAVFKRLGFIADSLKSIPSPLLEKIHSHIKSGIIKLDPHGSESGPINTKWGVRVNVPWGDLT